VFEPWADGPLPGAEELCSRHVCLPVSAVMTTDQADRVCEALAAVVQ
jgi:dTDP-4-amino-4,6-dideoxygalactose transaminase